MAAGDKIPFYECTSCEAIVGFPPDGPDLPCWHCGGRNARQEVMIEMQTYDSWEEAEGAFQQWKADNPGEWPDASS